MAKELSARTEVLLVRLGSRLCALPLVGVVECLRPLPIESVPGTPVLLGLSIVRGRPVPVVRLAALVGVQTDAPIGRFVVLRLGERRAVIAVEEVVGVRRVENALLHDLPPVLRDADSDRVAAIGVKDEQLLFVLRLTRAVPDEVWQVLESSGGRV